MVSLVASLYDLAAEPEIMQDVREEIHRVLQEHDGKITSKMLFDLKLLDAVCKESQRLNPADLRMCLVPYPPPPNHVTQSDHRCSVSARRRVMQPFTFSDGTAVPVGTMLAVPVYHIGRDPALFPQDPEKFDPYRFTRLRSKDAEGGGNHLQFASVTHGTMAFGWGKHACPGRFFAAAEIKLILLHMLLNFEVAVVPGPDGVKRYPNVEMGNMVSVLKNLVLSICNFVNCGADEKCFRTCLISSVGCCLKAFAGEIFKSMVHTVRYKSRRVYSRVTLLLWIMPCVEE